jgi:hypothetical protein
MVHISNPACKTTKQLEASTRKIYRFRFTLLKVGRRSSPISMPASSAAARNVLPLAVDAALL